MSMELKRYRFFLLITMISFLISAGSLLAIPAISGSTDEAQKVLSLVLASLFWIGFIFGIVMTVLTDKAMLKIRRKAYSMKKPEKISLPGVLMFSKGITNYIIYGILILGVVVLVSDLIFGWLSENVMFPILSVTYITFVIHSIIDGKNYKSYITVKEGMRND